MPELRRDPITGRWVVIATERQKRPSDFRPGTAPAFGRDGCPFCPGHEDLTPPEILAIRSNGDGSNGPGWDVRVVPNKFPVLRVEGMLDPQGDGMYDRMNGIGAHEVIIETPDHDRTLSQMSEPEIERILWAYRERMLDLKQDRRLCYVVVFKNHGAAAGASLEHPHSQLVALPIIPGFVREQLEGARQHYALKARCIYCDIVHHDTTDRRRIIQENADMVALAPYASRFPFETWLLPRRHGARFEEAPRHEHESLARLLKAVMMRFDRALESPSYNLVLHSLPFAEPAVDMYHWHIELVPRLTRPAGFESATGFYINQTSPEEAARVLAAVRL